ncbi:hypothetical protein FRC01_012954 [Tulasnella sp. 417]|nr:hypothetical protein FRC01_012954 [Tulasnella sp. 417]
MTQTTFYVHLLYLLLVCTPFANPDEPHDLSELVLIQHGPEIHCISDALGHAKLVIICNRSTQFDEIQINIDDVSFTSLTVNPDTSLSVQGELPHYLWVSSDIHIGLKALNKWPKVIDFTLKEFWNWRYDPVIFNLLDLNCHLHAGRSPWIM